MCASQRKEHNTMFVARRDHHKILKNIILRIILPNVSVMTEFILYQLKFTYSE